MEEKGRKEGQREVCEVSCLPFFLNWESWFRTVVSRTREATTMERERKRQDMEPTKRGATTRRHTTFKSIRQFERSITTSPQPSSTTSRISKSMTDLIATLWQCHSKRSPFAVDFLSTRCPPKTGHIIRVDKANHNTTSTTWKQK